VFLVLTLGVLSYFWLIFCNILLHHTMHILLAKIGDVDFKISVFRTLTLVIRVLA